MSDLIRRSALMETIRRNGIKGDGYDDYERENDVIDMIESLPTFEAEEWYKELQNIRNTVIDEFYIEALNFEDYIEPVAEARGMLLYSGRDITHMVVKIRRALLDGRNEE